MFDPLRRFLPLDVAGGGCAGLLLALSFPRPDLTWLAWIGLVPLFLTMDQRPFRSGFAAGVTFFAVTLYWLNIVMTTYGGLNLFLSVAAYLMLIAYLALYFGVATWTASQLRKHRGVAITFSLPIVWVALEFVRAHALSGFPWANLGYSQHRWLTVVQIADLFGIYGIGFLLVLVNAVIALVVRALWQRSPGDMPIKSLVIALLLVAGTVSYGHYRLDNAPDLRDETWSTALVQGNVDQGLKWDSRYRWSIIDRYRSMSLEAAQEKPDLIVWPEAATPFFYQEPGQPRELVSALPRQTGAHLLFGSPAYEYRDEERVSFNSSYLLDPDGRELGRSDKVHLVPFGEYVPLKPLLPFVNKLVVGIGDFKPGDLQPLALNGSELGVLVCYEAIFPELAREYVNRGADLLVNITNDAWFGRSSAPWQHLAMSRFRAIENRVWMARAANTGVSALIGPSGRVVVQGGLFNEQIVKGDVGLGARPTLYRALGDVLPWGCLLLTVIGLIWLRRGKGSKADSADSAGSAGSADSAA